MMDQRDSLLLVEMRQLIQANGTEARSVGLMADRLIDLRDRLMMSDAEWFHEFTQHVATLDSASTFIPADRDQNVKLDNAIRSSQAGLIKLIERKLELYSARHER